VLCVIDTPVVIRVNSNMINSEIVVSFVRSILV